MLKLIKDWKKLNNMPYYTGLAFFQKLNYIHAHYFMKHYVKHKDRNVKKREKLLEEGVDWYGNF